MSEAPLLVTGATGMVGRSLLERLRGRPLAAVARSGPPPWAGEHPEVEWLTADLRSEALASALPGRVSGIVHLAQSERDGSDPEGADDVLEVNTGSTARLLDYAGAAGATRFLLASTATVYRHSPGPIAEGGATEPSSTYALSKLKAEQLLEAYASLLDGLALRLFTAYGRPQPGRLVWELTRRVRAGEPVQVQGERGLLLSPIHADDVAAAIEAALGRVPEPRYEVLNVGGAEALGIREIAETIGEAAGREPVIEAVDGPEPGGLVCDGGRARKALGLGAPLGFREGIERMLAGPGA